MQLAGLLVFEGPAPTLDEVRAAVAARLHLLPRFRQRLDFVPLGLGRPAWVDADPFDVTEHIGHAVRPAPGGEDAIKTHVDALSEQPLDKTRPLWRMQLVEGLSDGRFALGLVLHHCMVDGLAIMNIFGTLLSPDPNAADPIAEPWTPSPAPSTGERLLAGTADAIRTPGRLIQGVTGSAPSRVRRLVGLATALGNAPRAPMNGGRATRRRSTQWLEFDLDDIKAVRRACDTTVNNVVLAAVAGGLRRYAERTGEGVADLHAFVPVNVRADADTGDLGNHISMTYPRLPVSEADPLSRVAAAAAEVERLKRTDQAGAVGDLIAFSGLIPPALAARVNRTMYFAGGLFNLTITNVPGPPIPLYFAGRRLTALGGAAPLTAQHALTIAFLSYDGRVFVSITADPARVPDSASFAADLDASFAELIALG